MFPESIDRLLPTNVNLNLIHNVYAIVGLIILLYGVVSVFLTERLFINEAVLALLFGIGLGPYAIGLFNPDEYFGKNLETVLLEFSRLIVGICCTKIGLSLPPRFMWTNLRDMGMILGPVMIFMFLVMSLGVYFIMGYSILNSFIIGACLTPTDPVLISAVIKGRFAEKYVSKRVRNLMAAESASNDALGFCFLYLPFYFSKIFPPVDAFWLFFVKIIGYQLMLGALLGFIIGFTLSKLLQLSSLGGWVEKESLLGILLAVTVATIGVAARLGLDDLVACLFLGIGIVWDEWFLNEMNEAESIEIVDTIFNVLYFFLLGTLLPFNRFAEIGWSKLVILAAWSMIIRRLPVLLALYRWIPSIESVGDAAFIGWFAPAGVDTVLYAMVSIQLIPELENTVLPIVLFMLFSGTVILGGSVPIIAKFMKSASKYDGCETSEGIPLDMYGTSDSSQPLRYGT